MIELINRAFVPVWIDVRKTPLPRLPFVADVLANARVDENNKVVDPFSRGFFLRSAALSPDGLTLLNRQPKTLAKMIGAALRDGTEGYAIVDAPDYLSMLQHALERLSDRADYSASNSAATP